MIIFLYGPDDYRREEKKRWYISEFRKKYPGFGVEFFDLADEEADWVADFKSFIRNQSIFDKTKLAVLEGAFEEGVREKIAPELKNILSDKNTSAIISERKEPVKILDFLLKKPATFEEFGNLSGYNPELFIRSEAKKMGLALQSDAAQFLAEVYRENTWGLVTELQKIGNLKNGPEAEQARYGASAVGRRDLENLDLEIAPNYWAAINGLKSRGAASRLVALEILLATGDPPPRIFNILASQWREKIPQMAEYDLKIKSGKMDYEEALLDLAIS
jgi:DNA polymerase III delta subunit